MEIDLDRFVEAEFGRGKLIVGWTDQIPSRAEPRFGVMISTAKESGPHGSDASGDPDPPGGLFLTFPTKEQAIRVHQALLNTPTEESR